MGASDFDTFVGPDKRKLPRLSDLGMVVVVLAGLVLIGMIVLWPTGEPDVDFDLIGFADDTAVAVVDTTELGPCPFFPELECSFVGMTVTDGDLDGEVVSLDFVNEPGQPNLNPGDRVFLSVVELSDGSLSFQYADRDRRTLIWIMAVVFAAAVIGLGRMKGVAALAGLGISVAVLLFFILPAIIRGEDAMLVALVGGGAIALVSLYLAHGYNPLTHAAALGTFAALILTVLLSWLAVTLASFSGLTGGEVFYLTAIPGLDLSGLILAGIVLGTLGALDDVTVTQASAVWEVHSANPSLTTGELYSSGIRVGRDHIVSTTNTLLLAYAGASLPLLILFSLSSQSFGVVASSEVIAVEIFRTLVGTLGLVAAVPITTWLAARIAGRVAPESTAL